MSTNQPSRAALRVSGRALLAALLALYVVPAFLEAWGLAEVAKPVLFNLAMLAAVFAVSEQRRGRVIGFLILLPPMAGLWVKHLAPAARGGVLQTALMGYLVVLVAFAAWRLLRLVLSVTEVDVEVLAHGVSIYLLLGLLWSFLYLLVDGVQPGAFHQQLVEQDAFYFSICTLTTAGYGDITPLSDQARTLAIMESMTGVLYVGVLIARLVSLYSQRPAKPPD